MKSVIVAGGKMPSKELFLSEIKNADCLIAADRGAEVFYEYGVMPHILIGDFDSADKIVIDYFRDVEMVKFLPEKDYTDSELAFNRAIEKGSEEIVLLGCTGSRLDHVLGNLGLLRKALELNKRAKIKDDNNTIFLVEGKTTLCGNYGQTISFQCYGDVVKKLSIEGAKYPLKEYDLKIGDSRTVSNEFINTPIEVDFLSGKLLVIYSRD
ncbi:thiamine pyrophosphokinase [Clostridium polyendosporum]|uniref:Thiamine diphosphokinase n=1 Tax=Clostridium polyendosporum TaxID=69208 RepID=A0A919RY30_9CLOT|nr:thiamine diphosphokinase [Clostridium polyendosporum]GIM27851.1 thiamine pyrophosphokinase [Clostridium polyendosporum]